MKGIKFITGYTIYNMASNQILQTKETNMAKLLALVFLGGSTVPPFSSVLVYMNFFLLLSLCDTVIVIIQARAPRKPC